MTPQADSVRAGLLPILTVRLGAEQDIVVARQRARQLAALLEFSSQDQVGIATAVSEIARNAFQYAVDGQIDFAVDLQAQPQFFAIHVHDRGPGIRDLEAVLDGRYRSTTGMGLGITGTRRLVERFHISSTPTSGTSVRFGKSRPAQLRWLTTENIRQITDRLQQTPTSRLSDELRQMETEVAQSLTRIRERETELDRKQLELQRLNLELEETNRGVVALYAELEERAAALKRADELKSRFLSHVSHEFRTPVNSVKALARLLLRRTDGALTAEQEKQVSFILKAADGLTEMVDDLLDLAKVEAGKTEVRPRLVDVNQTFGAVRALMRPLATNDAVTLTFVEAPSDLTVYTDEAKLGQILRNLVSNALKFTEKGEVRVEASVSLDDDCVHFRVIDTGIGLAPENQERIFQEFSQISSPLQNAVKGTGLGLPLSRRLAELLGGSLSVESVLNQGSVFTLRLPRSGPREFSETSGPLARIDATILLVDDEEAARYVCHHMFQGSPYKILEATPLEAAERARFERPSLIILDLMMPGRTGFDVLDELHADPSTASIPVVIHTSKVITQADLHRINSRAIGILAKSGQHRAPVLQAIRDVLQGGIL